MIKNAIVVMFDSLQFNYLGCYGNDWIKTPNMDRLAREGVLFENCYTEGLPTIPARRSMHTGRFTLPEGGWRPLSMEDTIISDLCWGRPIDTALIFDCPMYRQPKFGYTRGFDKVFFTHGHELDHYYYEKDPLIHEDPMDYVSEDMLNRAAHQLGEQAVMTQLNEMTGYLKQTQYWKSPDDRYCAKTFRKAIEYLEQADRNKQFYLWVDSFDPHEPWNPPSVYMKFPCPYDPEYTGPDNFIPQGGLVNGLYTEEEMNHVRMLYAELVTLCDTYFGEFLDAVRRLGLEENTLLMMVSDHGEPMGNAEHGHGIMRKCRPWPYEELAHTPMIIRFPGCPAGKRVKSFIQSVDVAPTVCDWLGIGVHPAMQGKSLLPLALGEVDKIHDFAIAGYYGAGWALFTDDWSYVHWPLNDKKTASWYEDQGKHINKTMADIGRGSADVAGGAVARKIAFQDAVQAAEAATKEDPLARHKANVTLDGEAQWTCTPSATYDTPPNDELYDRKADPFQLNNVISQYPQQALRMLETLKDYIEELKNS